MNRPSNSASSASWRLVIGSTSTDSFSAMRAKCLIEFGDDGAVFSFSFGSYSTARSYLATERALGSRHSRLVWLFSDSRKNSPSPLASRVMARGRMRSIDSRVPGSTITSSAGQRNQSNKSRPNGSKRGSRAMPKQTRSLNSPSGWNSARRAQRLKFVLEIGQRVLVELLLAQLQHGLDGGHHAMAARLGEQRGVVALGLVGVGAGEVDDFRPPHVEQARPRQILARGDDLVRGLGVGQVAALVDKDDPAGHRRVPFQSPALCKVRPIMRSKSGTARFVITGFKSVCDSTGDDVHRLNRFGCHSQVGLLAPPSGFSKRSASPPSS